ERRGGEGRGGGMDEGRRPDRLPQPAGIAQRAQQRLDVVGDVLNLAVPLLLVGRQTLFGLGMFRLSPELRALERRKNGRIAAFSRQAFNKENSTCAVGRRGKG